MFASFIEGFAAIFDFDGTQFHNEGKASWSIKTCGERKSEGNRPPNEPRDSNPEQRYVFVPIPACTHI